MSLIHWFTGTSRIEITTADPILTLTSLNRQGFYLWDIAHTDSLHIQGNIYSFQIGKLNNYLSSRGEDIRLIYSKGLYRLIRRLKSRPVLIAGLIFAIFISLYLPTKILFVTVEGNHQIPEKRIVECVKDCGVGFWSTRREIRSEQVKNYLLSAIPELKWAGVNTYGCLAVISVREGIAEPQAVVKPAVSSLIASRDGIIQQITVTQGTPLCKVGQGVKKGQVLVSGYTDCGLVIKAGQAEAEVMAYTNRNLQAVTLAESVMRGPFVKKRTQFRLRIGKNIINFCKDSGIWDSTCVKIYSEINLTLPGGFVLPVSLIKEEYVFCIQQNSFKNNPADFEWLEIASGNYLKGTMVAGQILKSHIQCRLEDQIYSLDGKYTCQEMIGQKQYEEIVLDNGERN